MRRSERADPQLAMHRGAHPGIISYFNDHAPLFWAAASVSVLLTVSIFYRRFRTQNHRRS